MKKIKSLIPILVFISILFIGCTKKDDFSVREDLNDPNIDFSQVEIQDFIWQGLNLWYLWKEDVPNLVDTKIEDSEAYFNFLNSYSNPSDFFESLLYDRENTDVNSWIVDDYVKLENSLQGIAKSNGVKYRLAYETGSDTKLLGYVRYILPNSSASDKDIKRGDVFYAIDGEQLTINNYSDLLDRVTYTINFADLNGGNPIPNGKSVELTQVENFVENPVYIAKTLDVEGTKIGYIMYNGFDAGFEEDMDDAFTMLKNDGATELVLDLRYNGGGYGYLALQMASSITGQFPGKTLKKDVYNPTVQAFYEQNYSEDLVDKFTEKVINIKGETIRSSISNLNLNKLYVLTTSSTASSSEIVISGLQPYIDVVTIGTTTYGKYTGSITMYDSDSFFKSGANLNPNHKWAMQPIVSKYTNSIDQDVKGGIPPTIELIDRVSLFGELGEVDEPLLAKAIETITGVVGKSSVSSKSQKDLIELRNIPSINKFENDYIIIKKLPIIKR
tara:strand:- start:3743 stop:5245 length:1503 start_codon:yes stop_codon:yes gene_type:complete